MIAATPASAPSARGGGLRVVCGALTTVVAAAGAAVATARFTSAGASARMKRSSAWIVDRSPSN